MWFDRGLLVAFTATTAAYLLLDAGGPRFVPWLAIYSGQFAIYVAIAWRARKRPPVLRSIVAVAIVCRVLLWLTDPVLEADYYRYLWDGHVTASGINPYQHPPEAPELDSIETDYRFFVTWSHIRTIYPPLAQYFFLLAHAVAPGSLLGLKVMLTLLDVLTGVLLTRWRADAAYLYWLNPLVLKEVANSAHVDALPVLLTTLAVVWMSRGERRQGAFIVLALGAAAKLYALLLVPLFARLDPEWKRHGFVAAVVFAALYLPFLSAGANLFSGTSTFAELWVFNAGLYRLIDAVVPAKPVVAASVLGLLAWRTRALHDPESLPREALVVLGALLLLSPVVNAWYVLWVLPFAVVCRSAPFLAFTYLVSFGYSWFHDPETAVFFRWAEYTLLLALLAASGSSIVGRSTEGETT